MRPKGIAIGERRRPEPHGRPGFLRIDTVHQGDLDGGNGVYHINAIDEGTLWPVMVAPPKISELWRIPVLEAMREQFPFRLRGFHSDNGSEYIHHAVALQARAAEQSDTEAALSMQQAKRELLRRIGRKIA